MKAILTAANLRVATIDLPGKWDADPPEVIRYGDDLYLYMGDGSGGLRYRKVAPYTVPTTTSGEAL